MHVKYGQRLIASYDMIHRYVRDNGRGLTVHVNFMVKCVCYIGLGSNDCFMTGTALLSSHYKAYIISGVGHLRSDLVVSLMLWTVVYNIRGTGVVLQVHRVTSRPK
jgi:hypothetical protein